MTRRYENMIATYLIKRTEYEPGKSTFTPTDLFHAWPGYWKTHDLTLDELIRIGNAASSLSEAKRIWTDEDWWLDATTD